MLYSIKILLIILAFGLAAVGCDRSPTAPRPPTAQPPTPDPPITVPTPPVRTSRTRYLAFGDSLTAGTTSPALTMFRKMDAGLPQSYPFKFQALLATRYGSQTIMVSNEGKPGEAAADGVLRLPSVLRTVAPEVVILMHGVNDVTFLGLPGVTRVAGYLNTMARDARLYGARVLICTLPPHRPGGFRAADPAVITAYNRALRDIARGEAAILLDFEALFDVRLLGLDGLHPTEEGYQRMAQILFDQARASFELAP